MSDSDYYSVTPNGLRKFHATGQGPRRVEIKPYYLVESGIVKVWYGKVCIICVAGDVFNSPDVEPVLKVIGDRADPVVSAIDAPTLEQVQVLADKLADKLELLTSGATTKEKVLDVKEELRQMGVKPTQIITGEYMFRTREVIGRSLKK